MRTFYFIEVVLKNKNNKKKVTEKHNFVALHLKMFIWRCSLHVLLTNHIPSFEELTTDEDTAFEQFS